MADAAVNGILARARDREYWRHLNPQLHIEESTALDPFRPTRDVASDLKRDGYFRVPDVIPAELCERIRRGMEVLRARQIPVVFIYVYDEVWQLVSRARALLEATVGEGFSMLPVFWSWWIDPRPEAGGWAPHRDRTDADTLLGDGMPRCISMWIPVSDATPDNGCIYVIPASLDEDYASRRFDQIRPQAALARALPATAGSVLVWNQCLIHWGGRSSVHAGHARVSLGMEFQRADARPFDRPLISPDDAPPLAKRLAYVGKSLHTYFGRTGFPLAFYEVAVHLAQVI